MSKRELYPDQFRTFDTPEKQEAERAVIQRYCERTNASGYEQKGIGARYDAEILTSDGAVREILEVKIRKLIRREMTYFAIDMKKVDYLRKTSARVGVPAFLAIEWKDGELVRLNLTDANPRDWQVHEFQSRIRREFPDLQYKIPVQEFEKI